MTTYNPDNWCVLKITNKESGKVHYRVFAGWYGGFTTGESWKINSGITKVTSAEIPKLSGTLKILKFYGESGSVYECVDDGRQPHMSLYMQGVLQGFQEREKDDGTIEVVNRHMWEQVFPVTAE